MKPDDFTFDIESISPFKLYRFNHPKLNEEVSFQYKIKNLIAIQF